MICLKFFAYCGFPNNFIDVVSPNSRVESKFLHVRMPSSVPDSSPHLKLGYLALFRFVSMVNDGELYAVFWSDNLEKSDQKSILSLRCHKFKRRRRYDKWNFAFVRLECERWQQLLRRCFETLIVHVCRSLFVSSNTTLLELQTLLFLFSSKICASKLGVRLIYGCGLYTDVYGIWI